MKKGRPFWAWKRDLAALRPVTDYLYVSARAAGGSAKMHAGRRFVGVRRCARVCFSKCTLSTPLRSFGKCFLRNWARQWDWINVDRKRVRREGGGWIYARDGLVGGLLAIGYRSPSNHPGSQAPLSIAKQSRLSYARCAFRARDRCQTLSRLLLLNIDAASKEWRFVKSQ